MDAIICRICARAAANLTPEETQELRGLLRSLVAHDPGMQQLTAAAQCTTHIDPPSLSEPEAAILELLDAAGQAYGLELVMRSNKRLKRGAVYVWLKHLEQAGLVESHPEPITDPRIGVQRRLYKLTPIGACTLRALQAPGQ